MVVAIPIEDDGTVFFNTGYAPFFVIYNVNGNAKSLIKVVKNPRACEQQPVCTTQAGCECLEMLKKDHEHIISHYNLVEILHECDVVLVKYVCDNTRRILEYVGITTYQIPPIILKEQHAINNFIVGGRRENRA